MNQILCSVIIPVYNVEDTLRRCIESVLKAKKNYKIEIILINDGSTDNSLEICGEYKRKYNFIELIDQKNKGLPGARNSGLKIAKGEYISFLDSDDTITEDYFDSIVPYMEKDWKLVHFGYNRIEKNKEFSFKPSFSELDREDIKRGMVNSSTNKMLWFVVRRVYKNDYLKKHNILFDENIKYGEDTDFSLKVFENLDKYLSIDKILYNYYENESSLTQQKFKVNLLEKYETQYQARKKMLYSDIDENAQLKDIAKNYIENSLLALLNNLKHNPERIDFSKELKKIRESVIYKECFTYYDYNWKHLKRSVLIKLFQIRQFLFLEIIFKKVL